MDLRLVTIALALCVCFGPGPCLGLNCYECNMHLCGRDESGLKESDRRANKEKCDKFREAMELTNQTARSDALESVNEEYGTCEPVIRKNCLACIKVDTTASYIGSRGVQYQSRVISKVCALEKPTVEKDDCDNRGAKYARSIVCVCYGDNCNTAVSLSSGLASLVALVLAKLL